jgi:hypothetical protein
MAGESPICDFDLLAACARSAEISAGAQFCMLHRGSKSSRS